MELTVLGRSPSWPDAGGACSGYLVTHEDTALVLDCGPGVLGVLRRHRAYDELDAVVLSHLHADHMLDVVPLASALTFGPRAGARRPQLHAPPGAREAFALVCRGGGMPADHVERALDLRAYAPQDELQVGPLRVTFRQVPHVGPTHAIAVTARDGARLVFGADHGPSDALVGFAAGADLLLLEATLDRPEPDGARVHLTPAEAGEHAARAGARRLLLVHRSDELDGPWAVEEAARAFGGPVEIARQGARLSL